MILTGMKSSKDLTRVYETILERFGEPIGKVTSDGEGVADERNGRGKAKDMGNRGFGAEFCESCNSILTMSESVCEKCGAMAPSMDEDGEHRKHSGRVQLQVQGEWGDTDGAWRPLKTFDTEEQAKEYVEKKLGAMPADLDTHSWNRWQMPLPSHAEGEPAPVRGRRDATFRLAHDEPDAGAFVREHRGEPPVNLMTMGHPSREEKKKRQINPNYTPHAMPKKSASVDWSGMDEADGRYPVTCDNDWCQAPLKGDEAEPDGQGRVICDKCRDQEGRFDDDVEDRNFHWRHSVPVREMKLGIADRMTGLPDRRNTEDVMEPEDLGMSFEPRNSIIQPGTLGKHTPKRRKTDEGGPLVNKPKGTKGVGKVPMDEEDMDEAGPLKDKRGGYKGGPEKGLDEEDEMDEIRGRQRAGGPGSEWDEPMEGGSRSCECGSTDIVKLLDDMVKCIECGSVWFDHDDSYGAKGMDEAGPLKDKRGGNKGDFEKGLDEDDDQGVVGKAKKFAGTVIGNTGKVADTLSKVPGVPAVAKGALAASGEVNKKVGASLKGDDVDEVAPPGREKQVKALKKTDVENPWAVAWSSYNKGRK